jgi:hypothetical protein
MVGNLAELRSLKTRAATGAVRRLTSDPAVVDLRIETEQRSAVTAFLIRHQFLVAKRLAKKTTIVIYAVFRQEFEDIFGVAGTVFVTRVTDLFSGDAWKAVRTESFRSSLVATASSHFA